MSYNVKTENGRNIIAGSLNPSEIDRVDSKVEGLKQDLSNAQTIAIGTPTVLNCTMSAITLRKVNKVVVLDFRAIFNNITPQNWVQILQIPEGFRPSQAVYATGSDAWGRTFIIDIYSNGKAQVYLEDSNLWGDYCYCNVSWIIN